MTDDPAEMAAQAQRCRRLAKWSSGSTQQTLLLLADDYARREQTALDGTAESPAIKSDRPKAI